jgi:hypothetical protein
VVAFGTQCLAQLQAAQAGEHQVQQQQRQLAAAREFEAFGPRARQLHAVALGAQASRQEIGDARIVLDDQDVHAC